MSQFPGMAVLNHGLQEVYEREPQPRTDLQKAETRLTRQYGTCETHKRQKKKCTCNIPEHVLVRLPTLAPNEDDCYTNDRDAPIESNNQTLSPAEPRYISRDARAINIYVQSALVRPVQNILATHPMFDESYSRLILLLKEWEEISAQEACAALHNIEMENFLALARRIKAKQPRWTS